MTVPRGEAHAEENEAIVRRELWQAVQRRLAVWAQGTARLKAQQSDFPPEPAPNSIRRFAAIARVSNCRARPSRKTAPNRAAFAVNLEGDVLE